LKAEERGFWKEKAEDKLQEKRIENEQGKKSWRANHRSYGNKNEQIKTRCCELETQKILTRTGKEKLSEKTLQRGKTATDTHIVSGLLVGAGINQQPQTFRVTIISDANKRCVSVL
jgi:hypothetical protein